MPTFLYLHSDIHPLLYPSTGFMNGTQVFCVVADTKVNIHGFGLSTAGILDEAYESLWLRVNMIKEQGCYAWLHRVPAQLQRAPATQIVVWWLPMELCHTEVLY